VVEGSQDVAWTVRGVAFGAPVIATLPVNAGFANGAAPGMAELGIPVNPAPDPEKDAAVILPTAVI
jgi:hypothetical protein